ncbi:MAG TPA: DegT/DnrJ/EryC1/StrS family aminotransferase, partial [Thermodesulfobacteriota bacterium]|nr:DegT/DnrJ/EryC1/StrS family aminotransferase [Thermodesulfobacteriota bacterium]
RESRKDPMNVPLLDLTKQYAKIRGRVNREMQRVLESQHFILGPAVEALERQMASYLDVPHAIGVASGTDAILLALMALGVKPGDRVLTVPFTFFASGGSISRLGAVPVFVDIDPATYNIDPNRLEDACRKSRSRKDRARFILPVHLFGQMADMKSIMEIAGRYEMRVVEDAAQAFGAWQHDSVRPNGKKMMMAGAVGDLGCFSFFPSKNLGGFGDGGLVTTGNEELARRVRLLRGHGAKEKYYHEMIGINSRLDALQAAVLGVKLPHLRGWSERRRRNAERYRKLFREHRLGRFISPPAEEKRSYHIYNQFVIRARERDSLRAYLKDHGIGTEIYYPVPLHLQECYHPLGHRTGDFPESEKAAREVLALPVFPELTLAQQNYVVRAIRKFYAR